uniref:Rubredoxin-like domain-containing protein n=1 Tax=Caenorhabditis tropicalis TaxID=1561998 RepID=A0A1I7TEK1_9PELO
MSANDGEELSQSLSTSQPYSIGQLARIEVEQPARKMRLMFGKRQVVFIRSDGLRSRIIRQNKNNQEDPKNTAQKEDDESQTLDQVINDVIKSQTRETVSSNMAKLEPTSAIDSSSDLISTLSTTKDVSQKPTTEILNPKTSHDFEIHNRIYHPPKRFHGESTMVSHKKRWTYQTACDINAEERSDDNQMYYVANPLFPMPRGRRSEISTATRMNYASQRIDNRKFRGQIEARNQIANSANERVTCEKCGMSYFYESKLMQERISYLPPINEEDLPTVLFDCPVCKIKTKVTS